MGNKVELTQKEKEILVALVKEGKLTYRELGNEFGCSPRYARYLYKKFTGEKPAARKRGNRL